MNHKIEKLLKNENGNYIFPFFWLHGESEETLREYMRVIYESNIRAVCVESRPHPDFCGEKWWQDMDVILDEARKRRMQVWILDDSHFPTGFANGAMAGQPDGLCRQSVCCRIYEPEGKTLHIGAQEILHPDPFVKSRIENYTMEKEPRVFEDDRLLAAYAVQYDEKGCLRFREGNGADLTPLLKGNELEWEVPEGKWKVYVLHLSRNHGYHRSYINMMDRDSCRILLDSVYEPHYQHYKDDFGTTIAGFFSDEPELGNGHMYDMDDAFGKPNDYPWSAELEEVLKGRLGEDYSRMMALLWETQADPEVTARVRYAYMDAVTELVKEDFSEQIGNWCREHGVKYIGHLIEDNNHHSRTGSSLGHYFRGLAGQDMAGIDDIGGQVFPQGEDISYDRGMFQRRDGEFYHYVLGKLGSSAAAIEPRKNGDSMCEIFGNYGWAEGVRLEKYLADHFLVRGINHFVPHAFSPKEFPDPDCPPHFYAHGHNPQYRHFGCLMAYINRVCELFEGGRHAAPIALMYDAEGDWTGEHMKMGKVAHLLADAQMEYDIIPQDVFADREKYHTSISDGRLYVHTQEYKAVVIPYTRYVTKTLADAVEEMTGEGIFVLFIDRYPEGICDTGITPESACREGCGMSGSLKGIADVAGLDSLTAYLKDRDVAEIRLSPEDNRVRYCHYMHEDGSNVWMFVNEGTSVYRGKVQFPVMESAAVYQYDAWDNRIMPAAMEGESLIMEIEPLKNRIIVFDTSSTEEEVQKMAATVICDTAEREAVEFAQDWSRSICAAIAYPAFESKKTVMLPDMLEMEEPDFSGVVRYENTITMEKPAKMYLEITDAHEGVEVFVNDISLGIQIVPVYKYDLSDAIKAGENKIRIEVATTLERQMAKMPNPMAMGRTVEATALSGIKGEVRLWRVK